MKHVFATAFAFLLTTLATQNASAQQVQFNVDFGNQTASITTNSNGMVIVFGNLQLARSRVQLLPGTLRIHSQVITDDLYRGEVVGMNPATQMIVVRINGSNYNYALTSLAVTEGCDQVLCVGEPVRTNDMYSATVLGLFANGDVAVSINGSNYRYALEKLGLMQACSGNYCTGDNVITNDSYNGVVDSIFSDGSLGIRINGSTYSYSWDKLSMTQAVCANIYIERVGLCR